MNAQPNETGPVVGRSDHDGSRDLSDDQTYELLANARRRACVRHLRNREGRGPSDGAVVSVRDLADAVADSVADDGPASDGLRQSVYTSLSQHHLDKLDEWEVVRYDREARSVATGPNFEAVTRVSVTPGTTRRGISAVALATSTVTVATLLAAAVASPRLATPPVLGVAALNLLPVGLFLQTQFDRDG
ncbi:hypothetical protein M0R89_20420 (plasmid) [Halorussus limi]|uniref:DUF7344 domain-containing protein n=1 Tax=Halorussus limi TaxID=2938695 RepID=A0A8U0I0D8_9EURY|nr:hypothetical protein [Halorussus limi]UPV76835.1 hypothetical protein M0R89_20420 [Halorussus limi]